MRKLKKLYKSDDWFDKSDEIKKILADHLTRCFSNIFLISSRLSNQSADFV